MTEEGERIALRRNGGMKASGRLGSVERMQAPIGSFMEGRIAAATSPIPSQIR
jgi:hypothetical protein